MSTADDLRDLRDALDSIAHGALPRWSKQTTKTGEEAQIAAQKVYQKWKDAIMHQAAAQISIERLALAEDRHRTINEIMTARIEKLETEREELRRERDQLKPRSIS